MENQVQSKGNAMSPHAANSLVHDLVQMAQAMEQLPMVRDELRDTQARLDAALNTVQRLESKLMDRATEIEGLHIQIRDLEVARDNAELSFLEAEDRTEKALAFVRTVFGNAGQLLQAVEPVKEELKAEPVSVQTDPSTHYEEARSSLGQVNPEGQVSGELSGEAQGQSEWDPITASTQTSQSLEPSQAVGDASTVEKVSTEPDGKYANKRYYDHTYYVPLSAWLAGGGTEESYNWLPDTVGSVL
jgi:hypothetical protein